MKAPAWHDQAHDLLTVEALRALPRTPAPCGRGDPQLALIFLVPGVAEARGDRGGLLTALSAGFDGDAYDQALPTRQQAALYGVAKGRAANCRVPGSMHTRWAAKKP